MTVDPTIKTRLIFRDNNWALMQRYESTSGCTFYFITNPYFRVKGEYLAVQHGDKWSIVNIIVNRFLENPNVPESIKLAINSIQMMVL